MVAIGVEEEALVLGFDRVVEDRVRVAFAAAEPPADMPPGSPFGPGIVALVTYPLVFAAIVAARGNRAMGLLTLGVTALSAWSFAASRSSTEAR